MLNWSFANERCLLDWTRADFEDYAAFIFNPTSAWVAPSKQTRFLGSAAMDFRDWPINPNWTLFQGSRGASSENDSSEEIDKNVWKREILCVKQFMDFYLKDIDVSRVNVALKTPKSLVFKRPEARGSISDEVLEWVLGSQSNPGRIDQFTRDGHGTCRQGQLLFTAKAWLQLARSLLVASSPKSEKQ